MGNFLPNFVTGIENDVIELRELALPFSVDLPDERRP